MNIQNNIEMPFIKGQSGNPGGRPKENSVVKKLARDHGESAINKLVELLGCGVPGTELAAANALLDRGYGKPAQAIIGGGEDDPPIQVAEIVIRAVDAARD